jgi:exopolyphosphatase/guanosine-5'-triphosphate,3'-diphosphate pyrophosphatase
MSAAQGQLFAAIDIGTNSVLLTLAQRVSGAEFSILDQRATVTRLGQDVDRTGRLHPEAETRTLTCLAKYRTLMDEAGVSVGRAVGTSAMRDAQGGEAFVEKATAVLGFRPEVISGLREAELTCVGALSGLDLGPHADQPVFVFDIGGGSTELIVGTLPKEQGQPVRIEQSTSLNIGSVRLTERNSLSDPPSHQQLTQLREQVDAALASSGITNGTSPLVVGVAGTVTTLAAISLKMSNYDPALIHGHCLSLVEIDRVSAELNALSLEKRLQMPGLSPGRADVIVAGSMLCGQIVRFARASELVVSDRGVRFGLLSEMMQSAP